ncbi:MAG: LamG-like jellyroll fold domain-containing protein [Planctomycetota bacterium]|jgi:hypothetical protein
MSKKLLFLTSFILVLALAGTNVVFGAVVIERQVNNSSDDREQDVGGGLGSADDSDLEMPYEDQGTPATDEQIIGIRWEDIAIPKGSAILEAWVRFDVDETKNGTDHVSLIIEGELSPDAVTFGGNDPDISSRPRTAAQVVWVPANWTVTHMKDQTSNIAPIIQEIVNQDGGAPGNALVLIISDDPSNPSRGIRCAESRDGAGSNTDRIPLLHIEFTTEHALGPSPADGALHEDNWASLSWASGETAVSHDLYFGDNLYDVATGTGDTFLGNLTAPYFLVGSPRDPYSADSLVPGVTYYWRVDERQADGTTYKGDVWSFTLPPKTAYNRDPADGARYVDLNVALSWEAGFGVKLHDVYFGESSTDVDAGTGGTYRGPVAGTTYNPGPLEYNKDYYWRIDEFDGLSTHQGDVWGFRTKPSIPIYESNLVGWWKLDDEGTDTVVVDYSGYDHHGTLGGDPQYVAGYDGDALELDGDDYVIIDGYKGVTGTGAFSITAWVRKEGPTGGNCEIVGWGSTGGGNRMEFRFNSGNNRIRIECGSGYAQNDTALTTGEWHHVALTVRENSTYADGPNFYLDGQLNTRANTDSDPVHPVANFNVIFGQRYNQTNDRWFTGLIDDVRIYDKELTAEEVGKAMLGDPRRAWGPSPAHESVPFIEEATPLTWTPGDSAANHDVYFGTSGMAVADADASDTTGIYRGQQDANSYTPPEALEFSETHYWRIDEVESDGTTIYRGRVWSFTIADFIVVDNFEDYNDWEPDRIFETWIDGWDNPANGAIVGYPFPYFGLGEHHAETNIVHWGAQAMPLFYNNSVGYSEATMPLSSVRDWTKHGVEALSLWFQGYPVSVGSFTEEPADTYTLAARSADNISGTADEFHFAYKQLSSAGSIIAKVEWVRDADDNAQAGIMIRDTLDPNSAHASVLLETNDIAADADLRFRLRVTRAGDSTTTTVDGIMAPQWLKVERDMAGTVTASYSADGSMWTQLGGQIITMNAPMYIGLVVASENANITCEAKFSNVQITGTVSPQWANQDIGILVNSSEPMYVALANSGGTPAVVYHDDSNATQINTWTEWNINLKQFADQGVNLTNVDSISIGFGNKNNPQPGGSGKMYFDDIRVYRPRCMLELLQPAADFNNDCLIDYLDLETMAAEWLESDSVVANVIPDPAGLVAHYKLDGDATDSSGNNYHGIEKGGPTYVAGKFGQAIHLDGFDDYVAIQNFNYASSGYPEVSVCAWVRTNDDNGQIASFDRSDNWRMEIGGEYAGGPGLVGWEVYTSTGQMDTGEHGPGNTRRVDDGQWHHLAGVFDNGTLTIYIDGNPRKPYFGGPTFGYGRYTRYGFLGCGSEASYPPPSGRQTGAYLEGDLDEVYIYNRALSQTEIAYLADETPGDGESYIPVLSIANLYDEESPLSRSVDFKDFARFADGWLDEQLWPAP